MGLAPPRGLATLCTDHCSTCSPGRKGHDDLTSSPPSSGLSPAVSLECPPEVLVTKDRVALVTGLNNISRHELTTAMQHLCLSSRRHQSISGKFSACQGQVRFFALLRIKPHAPPLVRAPSIHLSFNLAAVLPRRSTYRVSCATMISRIPTASRHRLRRGLPGYLILFAPTLSHLSVSISPGGRLRHWCSFLYLRISPLHRKFTTLYRTLAQ